MMKPLRTQAEIEKREKRNKTIIGIVIILLLVLSTAGFALNGVGIGNGDDSQNNDGVPYYSGQYWVYGAEGQQFYFTYQKDELNFSSEISKTFGDYYGKSLYIDSQDSLVLNEIAGNLGRFASKVGEACYGSCIRDLPEKTCEENMIVFKESAIQNIRSEQNCIFIDGDLKTVDAFLYKVLALN